MKSLDYPGYQAIQSKGWILAHKWLILRRLSQLSILALFLVGPWFGLWLVTGNLNSSLTLSVLPLTDPYLLLQSIAAGNVPESAAIIGAVIVFIFYLLVGGRVYCAWVCPVNLITDVAFWLRQKLGIKTASTLSKKYRYWLLASTFILALATGSIVWELVNPVSILQRGIIYGMGLAWLVVAIVFLLDLLVSRRAWCSHLCPVGAFYSLLGQFSVLRIRADARDKCDDCMDCFQVCPEHSIIRPVLKGQDKGIAPVILSPNCTNCGRCIDVCAQNVFHFGLRFDMSRIDMNNSQSQDSSSLKTEVS